MKIVTNTEKKKMKTITFYLNQTVDSPRNSGHQTKEKSKLVSETKQQQFLSHSQIILPEKGKDETISGEYVERGYHLRIINE